MVEATYTRIAQAVKSRFTNAVNDAVHKVQVIDGELNYCWANITGETYDVFKEYLSSQHQLIKEGYDY